MLCAIYKSVRKPDYYLYIAKKDDFSSVPDVLMQQFGKPIFVMLLNLERRDTLAQADIKQVKHQLSTQGFYLQIPVKNEFIYKV